MFFRQYPDSLTQKYFRYQILSLERDFCAFVHVFGASEVLSAYVRVNRLKKQRYEHQHKPVTIIQILLDCVLSMLTVKRKSGRGGKKGSIGYGEENISHTASHEGKLRLIQFPSNSLLGLSYSPGAFDGVSRCFVTSFSQKGNFVGKETLRYQ